ncbi:MAG TPA: cysteine desulfurase family protein, partial [Halanaerobiales bacterium]|nr:cysteine desulfurase family protein [Halanaerobiales bacterium]
TTRPLPEVAEIINRVLTEEYGNPSSLHNKGLEAEKLVKKARKLIALKLGVSPDEICFTSGGTESNNLAIKGITEKYQGRGKHLITTAIEHPSVLESFSSLSEKGFEISVLKTDKRGYISPDELKETIRKDTILVSIFHVNNELGTIQPVEQIAQLIKERNQNTFFHVDAVQSFGKILLQPARWNIDMLSISAHKLHGPKGCGALYIKRGISPEIQQNGGGQENGIRSGTENTPGIAGFIPVLSQLPDYNSDFSRDDKLDSLREYFIEKIKKDYPAVQINSPEMGAPHIINLSFAGIKGEVLVHSLAAEGIYISTGSACHSRNREKSHVLQAIGLSPELIEGTVRVSFSHYNTIEEIDISINKIIEKIEQFF